MPSTTYSVGTGAEAVEKVELIWQDQNNSDKTITSKFEAGMSPNLIIRVKIKSNYKWASGFKIYRRTEV